MLGAPDTWGPWAGAHRACWTALSSNLVDKIFTGCAARLRKQRFLVSHNITALAWTRGGRGSRPPQWPGKNVLVKIEGLSSLPPAKSGHACYDNLMGRGYFYQMPNMYTCIAYLIEIRKFCSKNLVHKGVNFEAPNALKLTYEHL